MALHWLLPLAMLVAASSRNDTSIEHHNYIVQIYNPRFVCAGALFSARFVLTAAHCFQPQPNLEDVTVRAGETHIVAEFKGLPVLALQRHPLYAPLTLKHDIAVVRMREPILYTPRIGYMALCSKRYKAGALATLVGWSALHVERPLRSLTVPIVAHDQCETMLGQSFAQLPASVLCASAQNPHSLCYGDSGDPLVYDDELCGIASAFFGCADALHPDIYTDVFLNRDFISQAVILLDEREVLMGSRQKPSSKPNDLRAANKAAPL